MFQPTIRTLLAASAALLSLALSACDTPGRPPAEPTGPLPWTAAVGRLDVANGSCTATLVQPDIIVTAAHCLFPEGNKVAPSGITFMPNFGGQRLPVAHVAEIVAIGVDKMDPNDENDQTPRDVDWAILRLTQPITGIKPIPVEAMELEEIDARVKAGETLSNLGYGSYGIADNRHLHRAEKCSLVPEWREMTRKSGKIMVITTCPVIPVIQGDSGGPIVMTDGAENRRLIAVISGYWIRREGPLSLAVGATAFDKHLD